MDVSALKSRVTFPLWHFRAWLCDKGIPCADCTKRMKRAEEQVGEVYDIVCDAIDPELKGKLDIAGHEPLQQIKRVLEYD